MKYDFTKYLVESILEEEYIPKVNSEEEANPTDEMGHYNDLMTYMDSNGLSLQPFPKIEFVDDDQENAENLFGKTAYYDPNNKTVVLYTYGRHPKDILRSFAHELVHVHQDNEGRIGNIQTTNTNEDDDLVELEKEAYQTGNIMFRQWTDSLNEKKKEYGIDAYAAELARLRENIDKKAQKKHKGKSAPYGSAYKPVKEDTELKAFTAKVNPFQIYCDINNTLANGSEPLQWTEDGIRLWEYIEKYDPILLSNDEKVNDKIIWIKANISNLKQYIFINKNKKQEYAKPDRILIDNRSETIDNWNQAGGIGILFTDADDAIRQLEQLGL